MMTHNGNSSQEVAMERLERRSRGYELTTMNNTNRVRLLNFLLRNHHYVIGFLKKLAECVKSAQSNKVGLSHVTRF